MSKVCVLETSGYRASFVFTRDKFLERDFEIVVEFSLQPELGAVGVKSIPGRINVKDLVRLIAYFGDHVEKLRVTISPKSITFFTEALNFSFEALEGHVKGETEGAFALRFLVNVGRESETSHSVYVGGEAYTDLRQLNNFLSSLRALIEHTT